MSIEELVQAHREEFAKIARDKTHQRDSGKRADQLVVGLRHVLCCWILDEATEKDVCDISRRYTP